MPGLRWSSLRHLWYLAVSPKSLWTPIGEQEIKERRKTLPEGHTRETNAARHTGPGWDQVETADDSVSFEPDSTPFVHPLTERETAEEVYGMIWKWAQTNPDAYQLAIQIMKNSNPEAYSHMSNDELQTVLQTHAETAARKSTETVYEKRRDDRAWGVSH